MKKFLLLAVMALSIALGACAQIETGKKAPDFTLPDAKGEMVSLSSLRGDWVVLDFWGSWCGWCIKGFPEMKQNHAALGSKVKFVGVACGDSKDRWEAALGKYDLPWLNLWNDPEGTNAVLKKYPVQGFPTKLIINPEGYIVNVTVGEDPEFYNILRALVQ